MISLFLLFFNLAGRPQLHLLAINITRFRNVGALAWPPAAGLNLITGDNAQGKTNILEAIHLGVLGRSFRTRHEEECIPWSAREEREPAPAVIDVRLRRRPGEQCNRVVLTRESKEVFRDGAAVPRLGDLWEGSPIVTFSPADVDLFRESPSLRRRHLDLALCQTSRLYMEKLRDSQRALKHLNSLFRRRDFDSAARRAQAAAYYPLLGEASALIMRMRAEHLADLRGECAGQFEILGGAGKLDLDYTPSIKPASGNSEPMSGLEIAQRLEVRHEESERIGALALGPHRDDFSLRLDGRDLAKYGSQGQHRLAALALALAVASRLSEKLQEPPVLLLDDFGSELDAERRLAVLRHIRGRMQGFVTATQVSDLADASLFDEIKIVRSGGWS
ncbi:DNA replication/repair protein RecF [Candidatus Sumerlaeota bacterium]|nr:DNA replication/repair protein RecF [Candidatus Sumerlaeota bacterium]MBI3735127.1 DNA replication/repair protein RecF [Candidatus Sumerlaeota bacterium]